MVAYAAVISLLEILDAILEPDGPLIAHEKSLLESLREQVRILLDFVENYSAYSKRNECLEMKIREVAWKAEDVIESHMCGRLLSASPESKEDKRFECFVLAHALFWFLVWKFVWNRTLTRISFFEEHLNLTLKNYIFYILILISAIFTCHKHVAIERDLPFALRHPFYFFSVLDPKDLEISAAPITFTPYDSKLGDDEFRGVMNDMSSAVTEVVKIKEHAQAQHQDALSFASPSRRRRRGPGRTGKNAVLGLGGDLIEIKTLLASDASEIKIVPIVGMGGIGKTTLARQVYNDAYIVHHFDVRAWVTVSQDYSLRQVLLGLLDSAKILTEDMLKESETMLSQHLYQSLKSIRYLIVVDDIWDIEIWDAMRLYFPEDNNGSRVLLTTRLNNVALYVNPCSPLHEMRFLTQNDSWKLLCSKVFGKEGCPDELEGVGKEILHNCGGLPLTIVVIGGVLSKLRRTVGSWRRVADNLSSIFTEEDEHCMHVLLLSYNHLPPHLRACFLYMGVFIEAYDIPVDKIIQLWAAEGFLRPSRGESLEELAEAYMEELIERNLILVSNRSSGGKIKTCNIHDLLRNLCVQQSNKENFLHVIKSEFDVIHGDENTRRVSVHPDLLSSHSRFNYINRTQNLGVRTFLCTGAGFTEAPRVYLGYGLLRVLDLLTSHLPNFSSELFMLVHLRYLALTCNEAIPSSIINLTKLRTLIHYSSTYPDLPMGIWMMSKLRHLCVSPAYLPGPHWQIIEKNASLQDLQRLSNIRNFKCHRHILQRIPNLKQLEILYDDSAFLAWPEYQFEDLVHLQKLEILKLSFTYPPAASEIVYPPMFAFPNKLKKLTLCGSGIPWDDMTIVGALETLEVLKLRKNACRGTEWRPIEGQFCKIKYLLLEDVDLVIWEADGKHFPLLEHLVIRSCRNLNEIPRSIGEIPTLQMIDLVNCNLSVVDSAKELLEEQESMGNEDLKLYVDSRRPSMKKFYSTPRSDSDDVMETLNAVIKRTLELHSGHLG